MVFHIKYVSEEFSVEQIFSEDFKKQNISAVLSGQEVDHAKKRVALEFTGLFGKENELDAK